MKRFDVQFSVSCCAFLFVSSLGRPNSIFVAADAASRLNKLLGVGCVNTLDGGAAAD
jgi:hypothetical protein